MGLDVYLYQYDDAAAVEAAEAEAEAFSEATWAAAGVYEQMSTAEKDAVHAVTSAHNIAMGLDQWGTDNTRKRKVEIDSAKYPEHMFKIGYFRSSYNSGGIDPIAHDLIGMRLSDIFQPGDEYCIAPDWTLAREIAVEFHRKLSEAPRLRVATIDGNPFMPKHAASARDAISFVQEQRSKPSPFDGGAYSNAQGEFFLKGFTILAAIPGVSSFGDRSCVHLVYEDAGFDWYVQAAEIVIETIDYVLAQPDIASYRLHWSS